jgi:hypothetical protein
MEEVGILSPFKQPLQTKQFDNFALCRQIVLTLISGYVTGTPNPGDALVYHSNGSMLFVSLQYRLGSLGFLAGDEVEADGSWNTGYLDQRLALEWVQENIHYFGGDPSKVTIVGGSAGGGSVSGHLIWQGGVEDPPFRGAIIGTSTSLKLVDLFTLG